MENTTIQQTGAPEYEGDNLTCTSENAFAFAFQYSCSNINSSTKFTFGPIDIPAYDDSKGLIYVEAFRVSGRYGNPGSCGGSITYQFNGIYGVVDVNIDFNIPPKGVNTFNVGLSGPTSGSSGDYAVSYSSNGKAGLEGQWSITGPNANS